MTRFTNLIITLMISAAPFHTWAADYIIDKPGQHAYITFKASHLGYSYILGHFEDFEGRMTHDKDNPQNSSASITIKTNSLDTDHAERDKHLQGPDYFDAATYPLITFTSTGFTGDAKAGKLLGTLMLRGVTKAVELNIRQIGEGKDPWGGYRSGYEGDVILNAADFGLPAWIGNVEVELILEGIRQ